MSLPTFPKFRLLTNDLAGHWSATNDPSGGIGTVVTDLTGQGADMTFQVGQYVPDFDAGGTVAMDLRAGGYVLATKISPSYSQSTGFTLSMWVKRPTGVTTGNNLRWFDNQDGQSPFGGYRLQLSGGWTFGLANGASTIATPDVSPILNAALDSWLHVVVTSDASETIFYFDGTAIAPLAGQTAVQNQATGTSIGASRSGSVSENSFFDSTRIYSRSLSPVEVQQLFDGGRAEIFQPQIETGLIGHWSATLQGGGTTTLTDQLGRGQDGTLQAAAAFEADARAGGTHAIRIDTTDDWVDCGVILDDVGDEITISTWAQLDQVASRGVFASRGNWLTSGVPFFFGNANSISRVGWSIEATGLANPLITQDNPEWEHWAWTYNRVAQTSKIYRNGVEVHDGANNANWPAMGSSSNSLGLYGHVLATVGFYRGLHDTTRIYNRSLSSDEVLTLFSAGRGEDFTRSIDRGLVGKWSATLQDDKTPTAQAEDLSVNSNNGTIQNGTNLIAVDGDGDYGGTHYFDFDDASTGSMWVEFPHDTDFDNIYPSVSFWIKFASFDGDIFVTQNFDSNAGLGIRKTAGNDWGIDVDLGATGTLRFDVGTGNNLALDTWYHVVLIFRGTDRGDLYTNGRKGSAYSGSTTPANTGTNTEPCAFGSGIRGFRDLNGQLDSIRFYNRELSEEEVGELFKAGRGEKFRPPSESYNSLFGKASWSGSPDPELEVFCDCQDDAASTVVSNTAAADFTATANTDTLSVAGPGNGLDKALRLDGSDQVTGTLKQEIITPREATQFAWLRSTASVDGRMFRMEGSVQTASFMQLFMRDAETIYEFRTRVGAYNTETVSNDPSTWKHYSYYVTDDGISHGLHIDGVLADSASSIVNNDWNLDQALLGNSDRNCDIAGYGAFSRRLSDAHLQEVINGPEPFFLAPPSSPTGDTSISGVLTADTGVVDWQNNTATTQQFFYQWVKASNPAGENYQRIPGETSATLTITPDLDSYFIGVLVTPVNDGGIDPAERETLSEFVQVGSGLIPPINLGLQYKYSGTLDPNKTGTTVTNLVTPGTNDGALTGFAFKDDTGGPFNGTHSIDGIGTNDSQMLMSDEQFGFYGNSMSMWIRIDSASAGSTEQITFHFDSFATGTPRVQIHTDRVNVFTGNSINFNTTAFTDNQWHHLVVCVADENDAGGINDYAVYVDGVDIPVLPTTLNQWGPADAFAMGAIRGGRTEYEWDTARFYDRRITAAEAYTLFDGQRDEQFRESIDQGLVCQLSATLDPNKTGTTVTDLSPIGNDFAFVGGGGFQAADDPATGGTHYLDLSASGPVLEAPQQSEYEFQNTSVSFWFQWKGTRSQVFHFRDAANNSGWDIIGSGQNGFQFIGRVVVNDTDFLDDQWYHAVITRTPAGAAGDIQLYVDGVLKDTNANSGTITYPMTQANVSIGGRQSDVGGQNSLIWLDSIRIYDRILDASEVVTLFGAGRGEQFRNPEALSYNELFGKGSWTADPSLQGHWECQDDTGAPVVVDSSGRGRDATPQSTAVTSIAGPTSYLPKALQLDQSSAARFETESFFVPAAPGATQLCWMNTPISALGRWVTHQNSGSNGLALVRRPSLTVRAGVEWQTGIDIPINQWTFLAGSADPDGNYKALQDGVFTSTSGLTEHRQVTLEFSIGGTETNGSQGAFADVAHFSRPLSEAEMREAYTGPEEYFTSPPAAPTGSPDLNVGSELTADDGVIAGVGNSVASYLYQWERADTETAEEWQRIGGAEAKQYTIVAADDGKWLRCLVTPVNDGGFDSAEFETPSAAIQVGGAPIVTSPPISTVDPVASGTPQVNQTVNVSDTGTWVTGDDFLVANYDVRPGATNPANGEAFMRPSGDLMRFRNIDRDGNNHFSVFGRIRDEAGDQGRLSFTSYTYRINSSSQQGGTTAYWDFEGLDPVRLPVPPSADNTQVLWVWNNLTESSPGLFLYQWQAGSQADGSDMADLPGEINPSLTIPALLVDAYVRCNVAAINSEGGSGQLSNILGPILPGSSDVTVDALLGTSNSVGIAPTPSIGSDLDVGVVGKWSGSLDPNKTGTVQTDLIGSGNGTLSSVTWEDDVDPTVRGNTALDFGSSSMANITIPHDVAYNIGNTNKLSVSIWVKPVSESSQFYTLLVKGDAAPNFQWGVYWNGIGGTVSSGFISVWTDGNGSTAGVAETLQLLPLNNWYHLVATWDNDTNEMTIYLNGVAGTPDTADGSQNAANTIDMVQGRRGAILPFDGRLDTIRVYDRILSGADATALFNLGRDEGSVVVVTQQGVSNSVGLVPTPVVGGNITVEAGLGQSETQGIDPTPVVTTNVSEEAQLGVSLTQGLIPTPAVGGAVSVTAELGISHSVGLIPTPQVGGNAIANPELGVSVTKGLEPTPVTGGEVVVSPTTGQSETRGLDPTVVITRNITATPLLGISESRGEVPSLMIGGNVSITAALGISTTKGAIPDLLIEVKALPTEGESHTVGLAPTVVAQNVVVGKLHVLRTGVGKFLAFKIGR